MRRIAALLVVLGAACRDEVHEDAPLCPVDDEPCGIASVCRDGECVASGAYRDCTNSSATCGGLEPMCFATDDAFFGVCSWECGGPDDCWAAPEGFAADCFELLNGDNRCFVACGDDEACPSDMECQQGVCLFRADGCGQTASPGEPGQCMCDPGLVWCTSDPTDLDCCSSGGGGGGGDGGGGGGGGGCCRTCSTGKPCGDSCIARELQCNQPPGCAC